MLMQSFGLTIAVEKALRFPVFRVPIYIKWAARTKLKQNVRETWSMLTEFIQVLVN